MSVADFHRINAEELYSQGRTELNLVKEMTLIAKKTNKLTLSKGATSMVK